MNFYLVSLICILSVYNTQYLWFASFLITLYDPSDLYLISCLCLLHFPISASYAPSIICNLHWSMYSVLSTFCVFCTFTNLQLICVFYSYIHLLLLFAIFSALCLLQLYLIFSNLRLLRLSMIFSNLCLLQLSIIFSDLPLLWLSSLVYVLYNKTSQYMWNILFMLFNLCITVIHKVLLPYYFCRISQL